jgi:phage-related protein
LIEECIALVTATLISIYFFGIQRITNFLKCLLELVKHIMEMQTSNANVEKGGKQK